MEGLVAYGSGSDEETDAAVDVPAARGAGGDAAAAAGSEDSYFGDSGSESEDSAVVRRRAAEARLRDYGEEATSSGAEAAAAEQASLLPSAGDALGLVAGKPSFLDPEATRPLARPVHRGRPPGELAAEIAARDAAAAAPKAGDKRSAGWDIASMAPKQKGEAKAQPGVIAAAAKRSRPADDGGIVTAAQVALMGGQWRPSADVGQEEEEAAAPAAPGAARPGGVVKKKTAALPVSDFLDRGVGGAALPRSRQDRKDKEKEKRSRGQSSVSHWKSEAEMVLRQQYDS